MAGCGRGLMVDGVWQIRQHGWMRVSGGDRLKLHKGLLAGKQVGRQMILGQGKRQLITGPTTTTRNNSQKTQNYRGLKRVTTSVAETITWLREGEEPGLICRRGDEQIVAGGAGSR